MAINLKKLAATGGYLEKANIQFTNGLNCIIGARGTCKSTVVETIRFLFDSDPKKIREMLSGETTGQEDAVSHRGLINVTLAGATANCELIDDGVEAQSTTIERDAGTEPRIYKDGVKQIAERDILQCIEIYSQGELQQIAEDSHRRLQLIDRPNLKKISELKNVRKDLANKLKESGNGIRTRRTAIESRRAELKALESFQQTLTELQKARPTLSPELDAERSKFNQRQSVLTSASSLATKWNEFSNGLFPLVELVAECTAAAGALKRLNVEEASSLAESFDSIAQFVTNAKTEVNRISSALPERTQALAAVLDKLNERYVQLRKSQENLNDTLRKEDHIRQQINHLQRIQDEANKLNAELSVLLGQRTSLRTEIAKVNDEIYSLRVTQVEKVNQVYHEKVLLTLSQSSHSGGYRETLVSLLEKSRLRNQDEIAHQIASKILPHELVDMVEAADSQRLASLLDRDLGQMARLVGYLVDNTGLYDIETEIFEDVLEITLFDDGIPKRVDQLSKGQKATAMLPLILREAEYPLIFDQPEDDLDNRFIYETLVERIRELKKKRQLIFVTHNANIPVLGEAENVVVMKMENPNQAAIPDVGNIDAVKDKILNLLEGGAEAFRLRQAKYGTLLNE
jgi:DNA repair ATPase RecN